MTKYQIGDKVQVRIDLQNGKRYYMERSEVRDSAVLDMIQYAGEIVTIASCCSSGSGFKYTIHEDDQQWFWTDGMFVDIIPPATPDADSIPDVYEESPDKVVGIFESSKRRAPSQRDTLLKMLREAGSEGVLNTRMVKYCIGYRSRLAELYQMGYVVEVEHIESGLCRYTLISEPEQIKSPKNAYDMLFEIIESEFDGVVDTDELKEILRKNNLNVVRKHGAHKLAV